jgi:hypothetical protein
MDVKDKEIYTLKLNSGEEMVARIESQTDGELTISDPVSVGPGPQGMGLVPSLFTADPGQPIIINIHSIAMYARTDDSVRTKYIEATTGIRVPDKKILMS